MFDLQMSANQNTPYKVHTLTLKDAADCDAIAKAAFTMPWESVESCLNSTTTNGWGISDGTSLVGFALLSIIRDEAEILTCAIHPSYQRQGLGRQLFQKIISDIKAKGVIQLFLEVDVVNVPAQRLYHSLEFESIGLRKGYYRQSDGSHSDAVTMVLHLL